MNFSNFSKEFEFYLSPSKWKVEKPEVLVLCNETNEVNKLHQFHSKILLIKPIVERKNREN